MSAIARLGAMVVLAACLVAGSRARAIDPGAPAPPFELTLLDGSGSVRSRELIPAHDRTFIVFWWSSCPHCVEALVACERFHRQYGGEGVAVLGINADEGSLLAARGVIEANGIEFPNVHDDGGMVSACYGVPAETFTIFLVGGDGAISDSRIDPQGDIGASLEEMLLSPKRPDERGELVEKSPDASDGARGISLRGQQRIRYLCIDARGGSAAGLYGEPVSPGGSMQYRLQVEASKRLTNRLRAGALLRISNEGGDVLESGPEYLGSEWGSAFAEIGAGPFRARFGYFSLFMTPLTLMRWDWDNNPRVGGDTGCGCGGAAAGALLVESLEELGPDLVFEGALAAYGRADFEARLFYAIPRRAIETSYTEYRYGGAARARYSQEIAGFEARWQHLDGRTGQFWKTGVHAVTTYENRRSVDFAGLGYLSTDPWVSTWTVSVTGEAPLVRYVRLRGELIGWNRTDERGVLTEDGLVNVSREGGGGIGGVAVEKSQRLGLFLDYLRLTRDYYAPFAALSYDPNSEGFRASARTPLYGDLISLSLFHRRLREIGVSEPGMERALIRLSGASLDVDFDGALGAGLGWLEKRSQRGGLVFPSDERRRAIVASIHHDFGSHGVVRLQYERVNSETSSAGLAVESEADMYSLYSSLRF